MYNSGEKTPKYKTEVQVQFDDGTSLLGYIFLKQMQRISDFLNDPRQFLPFQKSDGPIVYIRKATIAKVIELKQQDEHDGPKDPYDVLGVSPNIGDEDLKHNFHNLCKHYHPDRVQTLDLPADLSEFASSRLLRIIDAYRRVTTSRHRAVGKQIFRPFWTKRRVT